MTRMGFVLGLQHHSGIEVVAEAETGEATLGLFRRHAPDVCLLDLLLPDRSGLELTRDLVAASPQVKIVVFSTVSASDTAHAALRAGAAAYVAKSMDLDEIVAVIRRVAVGVRGIVPPGIPPLSECFWSLALSPREVDVLRLVAQGATNQEVAAALDLSLPTVRTHLAHAFTKLGTDDRTEASMKALRLGLLGVL